MATPSPATPPPRGRDLNRCSSTDKENQIGPNANPFEERPRKRVRTKSQEPVELVKKPRSCSVLDDGVKDRILTPLDRIGNTFLPAPVMASDQSQSQTLPQPDVFPLVGRENECAVFQNFLRRCAGNWQNVVSELSPACFKTFSGTERCLYVSGGPGTGKTCSVRAAVRQLSETAIFEVNCMDLSQRTIGGLSDQLAEKCVEYQKGTSADHARCRLARQASPMGAAIEALKSIHQPTVLIIDEVDQLVPRGNRGRGCAGDLDELVSLTQQPGVPPMAIILIANAVDLLTRANLGKLALGGCASLLFEPYNKDQLRQIALPLLDTTVLDRATLEVRVRQVAKQSGDCRQVLSMCEEARFKAATATGPIKLSLKSNDPLQSINELPMEQQVLLCVLADSVSEAVRIDDVCKRYKKMCRDLHQPISLGTTGRVSSALEQLEQRGLLSLRMAAGKKQVAELAMTRDRVRENIPAFLQRFLN